MLLVACCERSTALCVHQQTPPRGVGHVHPPTHPLPARLPALGLQVDEFVHTSSGGEGKQASPSLQRRPRQQEQAQVLSTASAASLPERSGGGGRRLLARSYELGPGCVVGSTDFYLARPHGTRAVCRSAVARALCVSRAGRHGRVEG